jgi:hypothetical protein
MNGLMTAIGLFAALAGQPAEARATMQPCTITRDVLKPYASPETASLADFAAARKTLVAMHTQRCSGKVWTASEKKVLFDWLAAEMSLDWQNVFTAWERRGVKVDEFSAEGVAGFQRLLLEDLANVTTSADLGYRDTILRYADGTAIAKLGRQVYGEVLAAAQRPALLSGLGRKHDPQEEAIRALGIWLDPADKRFTTDEKQQMTRALTGLLSADGSYRPREYRMTVAVLKALGSSDSPEVVEKLSAWRHLNATQGGGLAVEAEQAANAVRERIQAKSM